MNEVFVSKVTADLSELQLTQAGKIRLCAFSDKVLDYAREVMRKNKPKIVPLFRWFFGVCKKRASVLGQELDWSKVNYLKNTFNIKDSDLTTTQTEVYVWPIQETKTIVHGTSSNQCNTCHNHLKACICGPRTTEDHCICSESPNKQCRGYARTYDHDFDKTIAAEHFARFVDKKGLEYMHLPPDFNPFVEDKHEV